MKWKKITAVVMAAAMMMGTLAGCGGDKNVAARMGLFI